VKLGFRPIGLKKIWRPERVNQLRGTDYAAGQKPPIHVLTAHSVSIPYAVLDGVPHLALTRLDDIVKTIVSPMGSISSFTTASYGCQERPRHHHAPQPKNKELVPLFFVPPGPSLSSWSCRLAGNVSMSLNSSVALSLPVNPDAWGQGAEGEKIQCHSCE
jgi:hypothetical protein